MTKVKIEANEQWPVLFISEEKADSEYAVEIDPGLIASWRELRMALHKVEFEIVKQAIGNGLDPELMGIDALVEEHGL